LLYHVVWPEAGIKPGITLGESDEFGFHATTDKVMSMTCHATLLNSSLDHTKLILPLPGPGFPAYGRLGEIVQKCSREYTDPPRNQSNHILTGFIEQRAIAVGRIGSGLLPKKVCPCCRRQQGWSAPPEAAEELFDQSKTAAWATSLPAAAEPQRRLVIAFGAALAAVIVIVTTPVCRHLTKAKRA